MKILDSIFSNIAEKANGLFKLRLLIIAFSITAVTYLQSEQGTHSPSLYVSDALWEQILPFIMPNSHPARPILDRLFSQSRAFCDENSLKKAGFYPAKPQHHTQIIVTSHPMLKGYILKAYLDCQEYHSEKPEYYFWVKRCVGARLIKRYIQMHHYTHLFKVPQKWIYLLPDNPSPPSLYLRKQFILVEEDMNLFDSQTNKKLWGSDRVNEELLQALFSMATELGLFDCTKPDNCPFSKDGKIAFIDTQSFGKSHVKYHRLTPLLSPKMQKYWKKLISEVKK